MARIFEKIIALYQPSFAEMYKKQLLESCSQSKQVL